MEGCKNLSDRNKLEAEVAELTLGLKAAIDKHAAAGGGQPCEPEDADAVRCQPSAAVGPHVKPAYAPSTPKDTWEEPERFAEVRKTKMAKEPSTLPQLMKVRVTSKLVEVTEQVVRAAMSPFDAATLHIQIESRKKGDIAFIEMDATTAAHVLYAKDEVWRQHKLRVSPYIHGEAPGKSSHEELQPHQKDYLLKYLQLCEEIITEAMLVVLPIYAEQEFERFKKELSTLNFECPTLDNHDSYEFFFAVLHTLDLAGDKPPPKFKSDSELRI